MRLLGKFYVQPIKTGSSYLSLTRSKKEKGYLEIELSLAMLK